MQRFIQLGDVRIKLSNIKTYGMTWEIEERSVPIEHSNAATAGILAGALISRVLETNLLPDDLWEKKEEVKVDVLYVTTFQNDNYRFYETTAKFDIHAKLKELDRCLS